jgi:hypothetical protein
MYNLEEWLARDSASGQLPGGIPQPQGTGLFALCRACNVELLGKHYVPAFVSFVQIGRELLSQLAERMAEYDARERGSELGVRFLKVNRLAVSKQIVSMMLVTSGRTVVEANPALEHFVRTPAAQGLPTNYRLFLGFSFGPAVRVTGLGARVDLVTQQQTIAVEVVYPPFAYALSFNGTAVYASGEITDWTTADYQSVTAQELRLPLGFSHTAFLGDLRTRAEIEATIREHEE